MGSGTVQRPGARTPNEPFPRRGRSVVGGVMETLQANGTHDHDILCSERQTTGEIVRWNKVRIFSITLGGLEQNLVDRASE